MRRINNLWMSNNGYLLVISGAAVLIVREVDRSTTTCLLRSPYHYAKSNRMPCIT